MNLVMCEGPNEMAVIEILLNAGKLIFTRDDLLDLRPFHARQIGSSGMVKTALNLYPEFVDVLRIGDTLTDHFKIPSEYEPKIVSVKKYCTKPEIEMLLILTEGLENEFEKVKAGKTNGAQRSSVRNISLRGANATITVHSFIMTILANDLRNWFKRSGGIGRYKEPTRKMKGIWLTC